MRTHDLGITLEDRWIDQYQAILNSLWIKIQHEKEHDQLR